MIKKMPNYKFIKTKLVETYQIEIILDYIVTKEDLIKSLSNLPDGAELKTFDVVGDDGIQNTIQLFFDNRKPYNQSMDADQKR